MLRIKQIKQNTQTETPVRINNLTVSQNTGPVLRRPNTKHKTESNSVLLTPPRPDGMVQGQKTGQQKGSPNDSNVQNGDGKTFSIRSFCVLFRTDPALALIAEGRKEQDSLIDNISAGLDVLKQGAQAMGSELESQDKVIEDTQRQTDNAIGEAKETVNHTAFRRHLPSTF